MVPLGPFNGKSFATTISPWVVLPAALEPFEVDKETAPELEGKEAPEYLREPEGVKSAYDLECTTRLRSASRRSLLLPLPSLSPAPLLLRLSLALSQSRP